MDPKDEPTLFMAGRRGRSESGFHEEQFLAQAPAPVAFPFSRISNERSPVQKLQHLHIAYSNLLRFVVVLALAARLEDEVGADEAARELVHLGQGSLEGWVAALGRLVAGLPDDALGEALRLFYQTLEVERTIRIREIVNMRAVESEVGQLTNLARFHKSQPANLADVDEASLEQGMRYALRMFREIAEPAVELFSFRLVQLTSPEGDQPAEMRELVGARETFPPLGREVPEGVIADRVYVERPDRGPLDLHPFAVFQQCYECYRENPHGDSREIFLYQGHSGRRVYYQGTRHRIATQELVAAFQSRISEGRPVEPASIDLASDVQQLLDGLAEKAVSRAREAGRYVPERYVPRKAAEHRVLRHLSHGDRPMLLIVGECGQGKSALLDRMAERLPQQGHLVLPLDLLGVVSDTDAGRAIDRQLGQPIDKLLALGEGILGPQKRLVLLVDHLDRSASPELFESFVTLAGNWEREYPFVRWVITMRPEYQTLIGSPEHSVLAPVEIDGLEGSVREHCYRLAPLDQQERNALHAQASKQDLFRTGTPLHLLKRSVRRMLCNPDLLLLTLAGYRAREIPPALTANRLLSRYWRKRVSTSKPRAEFVKALVRAMFEKRTEAVSIDDLIDAGEEALTQEVLSSGQSALIDGLCRDGVLVRHSSGEGLFSEAFYSFGHPHLLGYLLADQLSVDDRPPDAQAMAELSRESVGRNLSAELLFFLISRQAEAREYAWIEALVRDGGPVMRPILLRQLVQEEIHLRRRAPDAGDGLGPLATRLCALETGALAVLDLADATYRSGNHDRARILLTQLQESPGVGEARLAYLLGRVALQQGEHKLALKQFKKAEKRQKDARPEDDFRLVTAQAEVMLASEQAVKAEGLVRKLFDRLQVAEARELLVPCRLLLARCVAAGENAAEAAALFERALETAVQANDAMLVRQIRDAMATHLVATGDPAAAQRQLQRLLDEVGTYGDGLDETRLLVRLARLEPAGSEARRERLQKALSTAFLLGPSMTLAEVALALGEAEQQSDRLPQALDCFQQASEVGRLFEDELFLARALNRLGGAQQSRGDFQAALDHYSKSLEISKRLKDQPGLASCYHAIGLIFRSLGDGQKALDYYAKSAEVKKRLSDELGQAASWAQMAVLLAARGDDAEASRVLKAAREIFEAQDDQRGVATCLWSEGLIEQERGDNETARARYEAAQKIQEAAADRGGLAATYNQIALIHKARGDELAALKLFQQAAEIQQARGDRRGLSACYNNIGVIHDARGDFDKALEFYEMDLEITQELEDLPGTATSYNNLAILHYNQRNYVRALYYLEKSHDVYKQIGDKEAVEAMQDKIARVKAKM